MAGSDTAIVDLLAWVAHNGGSLHPDIEIHHDQGNGYFLRLRKDARPLAAETSILTCPNSVTLSFLNATSTSPFKPHCQQFPDEFLKVVHPWTVTVFFISQQYLSGEKSFWYPYIKSLPQPHQIEKLGTPLWFSEEDKVFLLGTNIEKTCLDREEDWRELWKAAVAILQAAEWDVTGYTWELIKWAATMLSSRSFISPLLDEARPDDGSSEHWREKLQTNEPFPVLFPLADNLNHRPMAKITWRPGKEELVLEIGEDLEPGEAIWNNYGPKTNEELLLGYGFCLQDNPFDLVLLKFNPPFTPALLEIRQQQASYESSSAEDTVHYLTSPFSKLGGYPSAIPEFKSFPPALLDTFTLFVANSRELRLLDLDPDLARTTLGVGQRNRFAVMAQLLAALRRKRDLILTHKPGRPQNDKQRNAKIYRDAQLDIIEDNIDVLETRLRSAVNGPTAEEGKSEHHHHHSQSPKLGPGTHELITLKGAVRLLEELDEPTYRAFRKGLKAALGTNKTRELREAGWEEAVWTLWIAAVFLWHHRHAVDTDEESPLRTSRAVRARLRAWMAYQLAQYPLDGATAPSPPPDSDEAVQELLGVVQAAARALPDRDSFWADRAWDTRFLRWATVLGMEEGVDIVLDDEDSDVRGEHVLFLEDGRSMPDLELDEGDVRGAEAV